ncbi:glycosyltransferase, group 4 family [Ancylostoma caninum]|uniref:UDP-N-acetylglucosamine--dolichyl-phosphate N-acetylglucosaminephosphotransferase n=1 Tax=Ancylostoma caninum TaxID=29170 RepID=A0A368FEA1_ANCCA|nr:glycosyltransferase, group 4 family [Ancylostoma caninum]
MVGISIAVNAVLSVVGYFACGSLIKEYIPIFIQRKMYGNDQCKKSNDPIPEPMGVICAAVYLIVMFVFIPVPFAVWLGTEAVFPYPKFLAFLSALISICTAILLGFADDVLDLKWRHKLAFPTLSSLPILMVYYVSGVNGLESGQALVIAMSVVTFNLIQVNRLEDQQWDHLLSLYFLIPFLSCTLALYQLNKYPARVFVGDTFCYWAGMTLAVVSILGHFSKTMILFLIPQVFNFLYSIPQLFKLVPCPRHRLPKFDPESDTVGMSKAEFKESDLKLLGTFTLKLFSAFGLLHSRTFERDGERWQEINNLTVLNLVLKFAGPLHERTLTNVLLSIQVVCSLFAFFVRFYLASWLYDVVY